jgi:ABC-type nitrate/sulfonate/bicarbonate transport system substrate-binding protein
VARGGVSPLFSDYQLLGTFGAGTQVIRKDFLAKNPQASRILVTGVARAIAWTQTQPRDVVVARFKEIITQRARKGEDTSVAELWKSTGLGESGGVIVDKDFTLWVDWLRANGQLSKSITAMDLYTNEFNELAGKGSNG